MSFKKIYNEIGSKYDDRYTQHSMGEIGHYISEHVKKNHFESILELGCGTGHWLQFIDNVNTIYGADLSLQMLKTSQSKNKSAKLICCNADTLPLKSNSFDLVFIVNAIHMFKDKRSVLKHLWEILKPGGQLLIVTIDPTDDDFQMYIYDYFDGTREFDQTRFTPVEVLINYLGAENYSHITHFPLFTVNNEYINGDVLNDAFIHKHNSSQLASLNQNEYKNGIKKIKQKIEYAEKIDQKCSFNTHITFHAITATVEK